ncbi:hypothetical protein BpHYR1_023224 [Brachionus plicatilis]|uniref:Uncharacterized protein n=1 Tax=Brachionus plicatilis TaxID=10195 RepID=A0A3M7SSU2_BRAPC|nr:hypothetical protein BpHYR1_023224 [Brachionus plicatilis]
MQLIRNAFQAQIVHSWLNKSDGGRGRAFEKVGRARPRADLIGKQVGFVQIDVYVCIVFTFVTVTVLVSFLLVRMLALVQLAEQFH